MGVDLKPCPFCGGEAEYNAVESVGKHWHRFSCSSCFAAADAHVELDRARDAWNRRAPDRQRDEGSVMGEFEGARVLLVRAMVASCTCGVKSPDYHWHDAGCRWRTLCELSDALDIAADVNATALRQRDEARAEAERLRDALREVERIYYTEGKDATWRAAHMRDVADEALSNKCPRCGSSAPHLHPAVQFEGEVECCTHDFHLTPTPQNKPEYIANVLAKRARAALTKNKGDR